MAPGPPFLRDLPGAGRPAPDVSVVVPAHDEEPSLRFLAMRVRDVLDRAGRTFELIVVDDGSRDGSAAALRALAEEDPRFRAIVLARRSGKSAALACGLAAARGRIVATMDADLQDLPEELPRILQPVEQGRADVAQAWRLDRRDATRKVVASKLFNRLCASASGLDLHDLNCGFKAMTLRAARALRLGDDMHRFVPILLHRQGFRVVEVRVRHARRAFGRSKYGAMRYLRGLHHLVVVVALERSRPPRPVEVAERIEPSSAEAEGAEGTEAVATPA